MDDERITIDGDRLKRDLMDYYGTAMTGGFPMAMMDLSRVEMASDEELIQMALEAGFDLWKYEI